MKRKRSKKYNGKHPGEMTHAELEAWHKKACVLLTSRTYRLCLNSKPVFKKAFKLIYELGYVHGIEFCQCGKGKPDFVD